MAVAVVQQQFDSSGVGASEFQGLWLQSFRVLYFKASVLHPELEWADLEAKKAVTAIVWYH